MAYGHAERNLALIRRLEAETEQLIHSLEHPVPGQSAVSREAVGSMDAAACAAGASPWAGQDVR
jgi:hypothetical protein